MTASLMCPNCGAPASAGAASCEYCGSALASVACPSCFGAMFAGMQFCPHCGSKGDRAIGDDRARPLVCPGCREEMRPVRVGATPMHDCPSCAGNWLDTTTFTELCTSREARGAVSTILGSAEGARPAASARGPVRYVPCPVCTKIMNRTNFGHRSGIVIDVCKGHGAWLEHRELQGVLAFIESGGFEKARTEDLKRQMDERLSLERAFHEIARAHPPVTVPFRINGSHDDDDSLLRRALEHLLF